MARIFTERIHAALPLLLHATGQEFGELTCDASDRARKRITVRCLCQGRSVSKRWKRHADIGRVSTAITWERSLRAIQVQLESRAPVFLSPRPRAAGSVHWF